MTFEFVSGRLCLDLVGTRQWRRRDNPREDLRRPADLASWALEARLVDVPMAITAADVGRTIEVRERLYRMIGLRLADEALDGDDIDELTRLASRPHLVPKLASNGSVRREGTVSQLLATVAADGIDLLASADTGAVRECSAEDCTRLFVDRSRGGGRRWCGMSACGNRAKVAAYRRRHRSG
jgi:predicted RNA-binding Zn ribbon-like protein